MTDERLAQARAEAERRVRDLFDRKIYGPANSAGYLVGHAEGVEWADANPKPRTITRAEFEGAWDCAYEEQGMGPPAIEQTLRILGIEVEDDDE